MTPLKLPMFVFGSVKPSLGLGIGTDDLSDISGLIIILTGYCTSELFLVSGILLIFEKAKVQ
jgi:hypothetical protein